MFWENTGGDAVPARAGVVLPADHLRQARHGMSDRPRQRSDAGRTGRRHPAVMDAVGSERAALFGMSDGGVIAAKFAAIDPARASHLIAMGSGPGTYVSPEIAEQVIADVHAPLGQRRDHREGRAERRPRAVDPRLDGSTAAPSVSPGAMAELIRMNTTFDVRPDLASVTAPTLVLHRTGDLLYGSPRAAELADGIPGARFVELPGNRPPPVLRGAGANPRAHRGVRHRAAAERRAPSEHRSAAVPAHRPRVRRARADRHGADEPADRRRAVHQPADRLAPPARHLRQDRDDQPDRGVGVRPPPRPGVARAATTRTCDATRGRIGRRCGAMGRS